MNPIRRHEKIMELLLQQKEVTVQELSAQLGVTGKTIREDLSLLEERGFVLRVHGGAMLAQSEQFGILPSREPLTIFSEEKTEIAAKACALLEPNDIIALDGGSTTLAIARAIGSLPLTVVTNDLYIISELVPKSNVRLVVPGGSRVRNVLTGPEAVSYLSHLNLKKAFVSATAVHPENGLSVYTTDSLEYKQALVRTANHVYAVADHHKFGRTALRTFARLSDVELILTDSGLSTEQAEEFRKAGVRVDRD
ncbi:DeoR/GlpR family DNA-binding transcription regulator [Gorillibacterium sp. CAU 1737]|uniref:DeoR/GlpR family DNA-binding transcription regulator n=1 Tax=Gorillibacterium sp. CAU 1737 TaxID=3140362 RepID=UPI00326107E2